MRNRANVAEDSEQRGKTSGPRERAAEKPDANTPKPMSAKSTNQPINVWLVEDNHSFRQTIVRVLKQSQDLDCARHFGNSEAALEELSHGAVPDVILLDVELPGLNGLEAVKQIRSIS